MSLKIIRNDITKMAVDAIVNTANEDPMVGDGCDTAVYNAAGRENLLDIRKQIGHIDEGDAAITPGLALPAKHIIHAVSPFYKEGDDRVEGKLRNCYKNSFKLALENDIRSIAFPLISTGSFGYPKEEGMRIAIDEINAFLMNHDMEVYLVVFGAGMTDLGRRFDPDLESYIDERYVAQRVEEEYKYSPESAKPEIIRLGSALSADDTILSCMSCAPEPAVFDEEKDSQSLDEHLKHLSDTFSEYLMYLIESRGMKNADVYNRAIVNKKVFSKIKNDPGYKPSKLTAMCLCVGAMLNLDQSRDLLARAGYALSPADKTDVIFSYFIEKGIYDMIELDIQLEEHGEKCIIS